MTHYRVVYATGITFDAVGERLVLLPSIYKDSPRVRSAAIDTGKGKDLIVLDPRAKVYVGDKCVHVGCTTDEMVEAQKKGVLP